MSDDMKLYPASWSLQSCAALDALFDEAREKGLWFFHGGLSGPLWFSPDELQAEQAKGQFVWGAVNWQLRDPMEGVKQLDKQAFALLGEKNRLLDRINRAALAKAQGEKDG